jgi:molybdopterin adenylyltransferase
MVEERRRAAVVTVSDGVASGVREDGSGDALARLLAREGFEVVRRAVVPDERDRIEGLLTGLASQAVPLVVTTGGTGLGPRDVTPEATRAVIDREAPGLAEAMRAAGRASTPFAALSREVVGALGATLIVNLPGSEEGATQSLTTILPVLSHALDLLAGDTVHGPSDHADHDHAHHDRAEGDHGSPGSDVDAELAARRAAGEDVVMATAVRTEGDPPCRVGMKLLVGRDGPLAGTLGCAEFDAAALEGSRQVLDDGRPSTQRYTHELGIVEVYLEPTLRPPRLIVFSATPVAGAIIRHARDLGFDPVLVEPRAERAAALRPIPAKPSLDAVPLDGELYAVHTDHDAPGVPETVAALLSTDARYVGVMGSLRHVGPHVERLKEMGLSEDQLARIRTPVGLDIGARSAEEIALSILAGLVAARHGRAGGWLDG